MFTNRCFPYGVRLSGQLNWRKSWHKQSNKAWNQNISNKTSRTYVMLDVMYRLISIREIWFRIREKMFWISFCNRQTQIQFFDYLNIIFEKSLKSIPFQSQWNEAPANKFVFFFNHSVIVLSQSYILHTSMKSDFFRGAYFYAENSHTLQRLQYQEM